ncbi:hypothetical protein [Serratia proteamaculans]|jgi:hypothetical protein|uniref:hypothetical protein n=1 Tax=Serratia proteamaculans TaxID=28151 RepID=UPI000D95808F|nr:hypothetical protein [Serratia proteamaculans]SPZ53098.1 Uncharacterised protein [Serratia quinivorans]CAI0938988.1 Uncharacterised protein [Serratia proteamaculans]CAI1000387.1 Uncharacterised protein [Serratia proteamaculans]CAI1013441.1 Uncharacterised protein [Serratia proteamaculans]CAI1535421.1 Uncharacterised protein [Serratia proteamaculans]
MVIKTTARIVAETASYELEVYKAEGEGLTMVKTYSSEEINSLTPRGRAITASPEDVIAVLKQAAKHIKPQTDPIIEVSGGIRRNRTHK